MNLKKKTFSRFFFIQNDRPLLAVFLLAFTARVSLFIHIILSANGVNAFHFRDTIQYLAPARELLSHGTFTVDKVADIVRTPGYPLLLTIGLCIGKVEVVTIMLQIAISTITVFLVYKTGLLCFKNKKAAILGAGFYAVDPLSILYSNVLVSETLFTCLLVLTVYAFILFLSRKKSEFLLAAAFTCSAATYVRPIGVFLPFVLFLFLISIICFSRPLRTIDVMACAALFPIFAIGTPYMWQMRNRAETGYNGFSAIRDINAYYYDAAAVTARTDHLPYLDVQEKFGYKAELYFMENPAQRPEAQAGHFREIYDKAATILSGHVPQFLQIHAGGMLRMLVDPGSTGFLQLLGIENKIDGLIGPALDKGILGAAVFLMKSHPLAFWSNAVLGSMLICMYLLMVFGFAASPQSALVYLMVLVPSYFVVVSGGASAVSRFRHPIMPFVCIFAGLGLYSVCTQYNRFPCAGKRRG